MFNKAYTRLVTRNTYHFLLLAFFMLTQFGGFAQNSSKKNNTAKSSSSKETQLKQIEKPVFNEKEFLAKRPVRIVDEEMVKTYEKYIPDYRAALTVADLEHHTYKDNNPIEVIIKMKRAYNIKDTYVDDLLTRMEKVKFELMSDEEKKIHSMQEEADRIKKASMPEQVSSPE